MESEYYELIIRTWENADAETKKANDYSIQKYVESGAFEKDALICWYEGLCEAPNIDDFRSIADYLEEAISTFLQIVDDPQYYRTLIV